jgi:hypothetical protein
MSIDRTDTERPPNWSRITDLAVAVLQRESDEPGHVHVRRALETAREELIAAIGHRPAAFLLRQLADRIEAEQ